MFENRDGGREYLTGNQNCSQLSNKDGGCISVVITLFITMSRSYKA